MSEWTATATANTTPCQVLEVLTHPAKIRGWSPIDFDVEELDGRRLAAGTRGRVTGRVAGVTVGFDVQVHHADEGRLELSADGPIGIDVRYDLRSGADGAEFDAWVSMRPSRGLTGRIVAGAASALLSAGALEGAADRIARAAEQHTLAPAA
jgi:hypothetical protein